MACCPVPAAIQGTLRALKNRLQLSRLSAIIMITVRACGWRGAHQRTVATVDLVALVAGVGVWAGWPHDPSGREEAQPRAIRAGVDGKGGAFSWGQATVTAAPRSVLSADSVAAEDPGSFNRERMVIMLKSSVCRVTALHVGGMIIGLCLASPLAEAGNYAFVTIDAPGAYGTEVYGINDNGLISGLSFNSSFQSTGFLYSQGTLTPYTAPLPGGGSAVDTEFYQVNNAGQVAVSYYGADGIYHAAVYSSLTASWTYLPDIAGAAENLAGGINNHGLVVGDTFTTSSFSGGQGWSWNGSHYSVFSARGPTPR